MRIQKWKYKSVELHNLEKKIDSVSTKLWTNEENSFTRKQNKMVS